MPKLVINHPHALGLQEAVERLKGRFSSIREDYKDEISSLEEHWNESSMSFRLVTRGVTVSGDVAVEPAQVSVDVQLPLVAMLLKGKIESRIRQRLGEILA
jgi:hypothetical protein